VAAITVLPEKAKALLCPVDEDERLLAEQISRRLERASIYIFNTRHVSSVQSRQRAVQAAQSSFFFQSSARVGWMMDLRRKILLRYFSDEI
jgi:hypothetical protein